MARKEDFDWLDDPFDEKKAAREQSQASSSGGAKIALGCVCLLAVVGFVALIIFTSISMVDVIAS